MKGCGRERSRERQGGGSVMQAKLAEAATRMWLHKAAGKGLVSQQAKGS
jgi:hypothetical protein